MIDTPLLYGLLIGLPVMLLALAVTYHAYLYLLHTQGRLGVVEQRMVMAPSTAVSAVDGVAPTTAASFPGEQAGPPPYVEPAGGLEDSYADEVSPAYGRDARYASPPPSRSMASPSALSDQVGDQLATQRQALQGLLSHARARLDGEEPPERTPARGPFVRRDASSRAGAFAPQPEPTKPEHQPVVPTGNLRNEVEQLAAEGLSDRSVARRLGIGLDEVRLVTRPRGSRTTPGGRPS